MKIEIYSDIACPWCYIGERRLKRALASFPGGDDIEVSFKPYQLDPNAPEVATPLPEYIEYRFGNRGKDMLSNVSATAAAEGIVMAWDKALAVNTRSAHRVMAHAIKEYGNSTQIALADKLFAMHFTEGGNVGDIEQLANAAESIGMDADEIRSLLTSDKGVSELEQEFEIARELGIQSVPTFVINGRHAIVGAQPSSTLLAVLEELTHKFKANQSSNND